MGELFTLKFYITTGELWTLLLDSIGSQGILGILCVRDIQNFLPYIIISLVHKYTHSQVHKYTKTQVDKFTCIQDHLYTSIQVHKYKSTQQSSFVIYLNV